MNIDKTTSRIFDYRIRASAIQLNPAPLYRFRYCGNKNKHVLGGAEITKSQVIDEIKMKYSNYLFNEIISVTQW